MAILRTDQMTQMYRIEQKLAALREADRGWTLFGAEQHKYVLESALGEDEISRIEKSYGIRLPEGYRQFLLEIGDGGAGPYHGLRKLTDALRFSGVAKDKTILSKPFPLDKPLDIFEECAGVPTWDDYFRRIETDDDYYDEVLECKAKFNKPYYRQGTIYLCDYGDAIVFRLVVSGPERGNIWITDQAGDFGGIFPLSPEGKGETRTDFLTWYENWLDRSLAGLNGDSVEDNGGGYFEYA